MGEIWDFLVGIGDAIEQFVLNLVESLWLYPSLFVMSGIDGFFPVFPSESVVNAVSSAWAQASVGWVDLTNPWLPGIFLAAAAGAWAGDQVAYAIGAHVDAAKLRVFRGDKGRATLEWAQRSLERRGGALIVGARHVPMGRVIVNLSAGTLRYPYRRFMVIDAIAATVWAAWNVTVGGVAGELFGGNLLLAIAVAVSFGVAIGYVAQKVLERFDIAPPELPDIAEPAEEKDASDRGGDAS